MNTLRTKLTLLRSRPFKRAWTTKDIALQEARRLDLDEMFGHVWSAS